MRVGVHRSHLEQRHVAEAARIVVADRRAAAHVEDYVVVARIGIAVVVERARRFAAARAARQDREAPGHAEVHRQRKPAPGLGDDVLRPARQPLDALPLEPAREARLEGETQIGAVECHGRERRALHRGGQAAPHNLDFGKFRHALKVARAAPFGKLILTKR